MEMRSFEEYLDGLKDQCIRVKLIKLVPSQIKSMYNMIISYEKLLSYNELIEVLDGNIGNFLIMDDCRYCSKDIIDHFNIYNFNQIEIKEDNNFISLTSSPFIMNISYDNNNCIEKIIKSDMIDHPIIYSYKYDDKNRLISYNNTYDINLFDFNSRPLEIPYILYNDENNISYDNYKDKYSKYDNDYNNQYSVGFDKNNKLNRLEKYVYKEDGTINIISIKLLINGDKIKLFKF